MTARVKFDALSGVLFSVATLFGSLAMAGESGDPIRIVLNNWSSQQVLARVSGELLERAGYRVEYHPADAQLQYPAIGNGDLHFQVEVWEGTMKLPFERQVARDRMIDAGTHAAVTREEWWYPEHVEAICPGLPDWKALNACAEKFATPDTAPLGRYLAGPVDWERPDRERVEALGLKFDVVNVHHPMTLWAELDAASRNKQPIVLMNWSPNWVETRYPGKFVEFPEHHADCETEAGWGVNPNLTHDCGNPARGWLKKGVWSGLPEKWPCAFEIIERIDFDNEQVKTAAAYAEVDEMSPEEAARRWIEENQALWAKWMPACAANMELTATTAAAETTAATPDVKLSTAAAEALAKQHNCLACHHMDNKLVGPALVDVAAKYKGDSQAVDKLSHKIKNGGSGNWGSVPMPPNPTLSDEEIRTLVDWILSSAKS